MCQTVSHENYNRISKLVPELQNLEKNHTAVFKQPVMDCLITVKQKGISVMLVEIAFCTERNGEQIPDHSIRVKLNHQEQKAEPESVWFRCRGTTKVYMPKVGINPAIQKVQNNTLNKWLEQLQPAHI